MSSASDGDSPRVGPFGLRLALWYATLFILGALAFAVLTYLVTASSLAARDQQILNAKLGEYAAVYARGGTRAVADTVRAEQATAPERLFVRVLDRGVETILVGMPEGWDPSAMELATAQFADGTVVQVGKSAEGRQELLRRFRLALGLLALAIAGIALTGGWVVTQSAIAPIQRLTLAVRRIVRTGRTDERVPVPRHEDAIGELTVLFNAMLDRIERLVAGMRGALDNVSHDLRTPLTRLRASAESALASEPDLARYREALADCVEETDRVLVMLETLMDISEAESGALPLKRNRVSMAAVVTRAVDLYRDVAEAKGVQLEARASEAESNDVEAVVTGDEVRLQQVAANLIDNAVKYTPRGGTVAVRALREGNRVALEVTDTGSGIAPPELPRIWERLFRGDASRAERGLGLGLSLVKAIVEAHGGTVDVRSEPGKGSTFTVWLPSA